MYVFTIQLNKPPVPFDYYSESAAKKRSKKVKKFEEEIIKKEKKTRNTPKNLKAKKTKDNQIKEVINLQDTNSAS